MYNDNHYNNYGAPPANYYGDPHFNRDNVFRNIDKKLKDMAYFVLIIGIIVSIIFSIVMFVKAGKASNAYNSHDSYYGNYSYNSSFSDILSSYVDLTKFYVSLGFWILFGGIFLSIFNSFICYGIGSCCEKNTPHNEDANPTSTPKYTSNNNQAVNTPNVGNTQPSERVAGDNEWKCPNCGRVNQNYVGTCGCGERRP